MNDWTDNFTAQCIMSFPNLRYFIMQAMDLGDQEVLLELLMAMEYQNRRDV